MVWCGVVWSVHGVSPLIAVLSVLSISLVGSGIASLPMNRDSLRQCPRCKEDISAEAVRCKHCWADFDPLPGHKGTCPLCFEAIHPHADRCKHCKGDFGRRASTGCGCSCSEPNRADSKWTAQGSFVIRRRDLPEGGIFGDVGTGVSAAGKTCGPCSSDAWSVTGSLLNPTVRHARECSMKVPIVHPNGSITWETIAWSEACGPTTQGWGSLQ